MKQGDSMTIQNGYKRRTFWQWLTRKPRELQVFRVTLVANGTAFDNRPMKLDYKP
jgi:hypothetical protein